MVAITFRTTDLTKWGTGAGVQLTADQVDVNFWNLKQAVEILQSTMPDALVSIDTFTVDGNQFYITLTDGTQQGPFTLPVIQWTFKDAWTPTTVYQANDVIVYENQIFLVLYGHISGATFDPNANDGLGNNYYQLMMSLSSFGIPSGGSTGQVLTKISNTNFDADWATPTGGGGGGASLDVALTYQSANLVPYGNLDNDPAYATPAWNYRGWTYDPLYGGYLYLSYTGSELYTITIPVNGLTVNSWYVVDFQSYLDGAYMKITSNGPTLVQKYVNGAVSFIFKAGMTTESFNLELVYPSAGFYGEIYNFTIRQIDPTGSVEITDGVNPVARFGYDKENLFIGGSNGTWYTDAQYGTVSPSTALYGNIAVGQGALTNLYNGQQRNVAIGQLALTTCTADDNVAIGFAALAKSSGNRNIGIGSYVLQSVTTGGDNIALGSEVAPMMTDGFFNTIIGMFAAPVITSGDGNVIIGHDTAGYLNSDYNVVIGHQAGSLITNKLSTGGKNVFIGWRTHTSKTAVTNAVALGADAQVIADNTVQLGDTAVVRAYVGLKAIGKPMHALISGGSAGNFTVTGISQSGDVVDRLDEVIYYPSGGGIFDLTSEFTVTADNTINNTGGTATTGGKLMVRWTSLN